MSYAALGKRCLNHWIDMLPFANAEIIWDFNLYPSGL
jgi:hypothetical protein